MQTGLHPQDLLDTLGYVVNPLEHLRTQFAQLPFLEVGEVSCDIRAYNLSDFVRKVSMIVTPDNVCKIDDGWIASSAFTRGRTVTDVCLAS